MVKNDARFAAIPVTARMMPTNAAAIDDATRGTPGIIVEKLLPAIKMQKHVGGIDAIANRKNMAAAIGPPMDCRMLS